MKKIIYILIIIFGMTICSFGQITSEYKVNVINENKIELRQYDIIDGLRGEIIRLNKTLYLDTIQVKRLLSCIYYCYDKKIELDKDSSIVKENINNVDKMFFNMYYKKGDKSFVRISINDPDYYESILGISKFVMIIDLYDEDDFINIYNLLTNIFSENK